MSSSPATSFTFFIPWKKSATQYGKVAIQELYKINISKKLFAIWFLTSLPATRWRQKQRLGLLLTRLEKIVPFSSGKCMRSQKHKQRVDDANNAGNAKPKNNQKWKISRRWRSTLRSPLRRWRGKISLILGRPTVIVFILQPLQLSKKRAPRRSSYRADVFTKSLELAA